PQQETIGHQATLRVSKPGAGKTFKTLWFACLFLGLALLLGSGVTLALASAAFRHKALPTSVFAPKKPGDEEDEDEDEDEERPRRARARDEEDDRPRRRSPDDRDEGRIRRRDEDEDDRPRRRDDRYRE